VPAALLYTGWPPQLAGGWAILICAAAFAVGLALAAVSGRVELEARGMLIKLVASHRFVPYSQTSSARVCIEGAGKERRSWVEVTLVTGERIRLGALDAESACRAIYAAVGDWERSCEDAKQPAAESRLDKGGPYRGRARS
jgi:hypothetical protein